MGQSRGIAAATLLVAVALLLFAISAPSAHAAFGFKAVAAGFEEEDGSPATQAGSHPFAWTVSLALNTTGSGSEAQPDGALKDLLIRLPTGLVGTPGLVPRCSRAEFLAQSCPPASKIGAISLHTSLSGTDGESFPLYNLEPLPGNAAELAFTVINMTVIIELHISATAPYNLIASIANASQSAAFFGATLTIEGAPGEAPFLTLPRSCRPAVTTFEADSWGSPGAWVSSLAPEPLIPTGCGNLDFRPTLNAQPTTTAARVPSGLDLSLDLRDEGLTSATGTANADLAAANLELPAAMTINPAIAAGLAACSRAQVAAETPTSGPGAGCPQSAKVGTAEVATPLLDKPVAGTVFVASPDDPSTTPPGIENPLDAGYALYIVLSDAARGVRVSVPIGIEADAASGRLTATVPTLPQLPFAHFELHFNSGPRAPLITPPCGTSAIAYALTPSSGNAPTSGTRPFAISSNCATSAFHPILSAGTTSNAAGSAAPFVLDLSGAAAGPNPAAVDLALPPGLSADLASVPACPESVAGVADCPPSSRLGTARIAVGPGPEPLWIPEAGRDPSGVYLAGPYRGAPYSLLVAVPAQAGPFDLGTVVLRAPIRIDPRTAIVSLGFDALPQILDGVPIEYRHIRLLLDRPGFIRNPTSCDPTEISATAISVDGVRAGLTSRFQAADCAALPFKPRLALHLSGGLARNGHPSLRAVVRSRSGEAGIAAASFTLPAGELLDLRHLRSLCARDLSPERCPAGSRLGHIRIWSPLLAAPLQGPLYLRAPSRHLPDLIADLRSGGVHIVLHGRTGAAGGRLRVRFAALPDVPLSKAVIAFAGGRRGILVNSEALCGRHQRASASLRAHSGKSRLLRPRLRLRGNC